VFLFSFLAQNATSLVDKLIHVNPIRQKFLNFQKISNNFVDAMKQQFINK